MCGKISIRRVKKPIKRRKQNHFQTYVQSKLCFCAVRKAKIVLTFVRKVVLRGNFCTTHNTASQTISNFARQTAMQSKSLFMHSSASKSVHKFFAASPKRFYTRRCNPKRLRKLISVAQPTKKTAQTLSKKLTFSFYMVLDEL